MSEQPVAAEITVEGAIECAARLLRAAEMETNHTLMERYEKLADSWVSLAGLLIAREQR